MDDQLRWYGELLPLAGAVVVDVGANVGRISEGLWHAVGPSGQVISVEPLTEHVCTISARIAGVGASNWRVVEAAISDRAGEVILSVFDDAEAGRNAMVVPEARLATAPRTARCRRLVDVAPDATVVKLDIEGHEYAVLDDALGSMPRVLGWALELHMVDGRPLAATLARLAETGLRLFAAGRARGQADGPWRSIAIPPTLEWSAIPVARQRADGSAFKMLHVIALR